MPNIHNTISFGLVNIPVVLNPLVHNNDTSFHQLHKKCLHRVKYMKYCPYCKQNLKETDIIKGYPYERGSYLEFTKKELDDLKPLKSEEIEIVSFIPLKEIDISYFEKNYKLTMEKKSKAYSLFLNALEKTKLVALCKMVLTTKFYYGIIRANKDYLILTTLYFEEEIDSLSKQDLAKITSKELELAIQLIESLKGHFEPEKYKDEYQDKMKEAIDSKLKGQRVKKGKTTSKKQVTDLMKALEMSLKK